MCGRISQMQSMRCENIQTYMHMINKLSALQYSTMGLKNEGRDNYSTDPGGTVRGTGLPQTNGDGLNKIPLLPCLVRPIAR